MSASKVENGSFSNLLTELISNSGELDFEAIIRRICRALTIEKGHFSLHADQSSHLVYDIQFYLYANSYKLSRKEDFLKVYPDIIALGDGQFSNSGYAPGFVENWITDRLSNGEIVLTSNGSLAFSDSYLSEFRRKVNGFR